MFKFGESTRKPYVGPQECRSYFHLGAPCHGTNFIPDSHWEILSRNNLGVEQARATKPRRQHEIAMSSGVSGRHPSVLPQSRSRPRSVTAPDALRWHVLRNAAHLPIQPTLFSMDLSSTVDWHSDRLFHLGKMCLTSMPIPDITKQAQQMVSGRPPHTAYGVETRRRGVCGACATMSSTRQGRPEV